MYVIGFSYKGGLVGLYHGFVIFSRYIPMLVHFCIPFCLITGKAREREENETVDLRFCVGLDFKENEKLVLTKVNNSSLLGWVEVSVFEALKGRILRVPLFLSPKEKVGIPLQKWVHIMFV